MDINGIQHNLKTDRLLYDGSEFLIRFQPL
jgi:hypothetical protein